MFYVYGNVFMSFVSTENSASLNTIYAPYVTVYYKIIH